MNDNLLLLNQFTLNKIPINHSEIIEIIKKSYISLRTGDSHNPPKSIVSDKDRFIGYSMIGRDASSESTGFKLVYEQDPSRKLDNYQFYSSIIIFDDINGKPLSFMDVLKLGPLRTSATTAIFAQLACPNARVALLVGTGVQGQTALPMLLAALPNLEKLIIHGSYQQGIQSITKKLKEIAPHKTIEISSNLPKSTAEADVIIGVAGLSCKEQVAFKNMKKGSVAILVGYGIDKDVVHNAQCLVATDIEQMEVTCEDLHDDSGNYPKFNAELPDILLGRQDIRKHDDDIVFAYNSGMVITDIALAKYFYDKAVELNLGTEVPIWG